MTLDKIKQQLKELTKMRRAGVDDEMMHALRTRTGKPPRITEEELSQREKALENQLGEWWVIWEDINQCYGIIPRE